MVPFVDPFECTVILYIQNRDKSAFVKMESLWARHRFIYDVVTYSRAQPDPNIYLHVYVLIPQEVLFTFEWCITYCTPLEADGPQIRATGRPLSASALTFSRPTKSSSRSPVIALPLEPPRIAELCRQPNDENTFCSQPIPTRTASLQNQNRENKPDHTLTQPA